MRERLYTIIFETNTKAGKTFDVVLLWLILLSVSVVILESVPNIGSRIPYLFIGIEYVMTLLFTIEYFLRIWTSPRPVRYIFSFWGFVDLLSILPTYLSILFAGFHYLLVIRILRLLRVFRVLRIVRFHKEAATLSQALRASVPKIIVFMLTVLFLVTILGTIMYVIEGEARGFDSIPKGIYWAIVTVTTVGYGDLTPHTTMGQVVSSITMILGYAIIAVPTGIVTVELSQTRNRLQCPQCQHANPNGSKFCNQCGSTLTGFPE